MNNEQDELIEAVTDVMVGTLGVYDAGRKIIALVEADVARRLLGWDAVRAAVDVMDDRTGFHEEEYAADTLREALIAAGITDAGQGGAEG